MTPIETELKIRRLLKTDMFLQDIATACDVHISVVVRIRDSELNFEKLAPPLRTLKRPVRCPTCGGKVYIVPCLACNPMTGYYEEEDD